MGQFDISDSEINLQSYNVDPTMLVDEVSATEYYVGVSRSFSDPSKLNWRIKRIWKVGNVWHFGFPNGAQKFEFSWDLRDTYTYSL